MSRTVCYLSSVGITAAGAAALLITHSGLLTANPEPLPSPEVQPAALSFNQIYPFVVGSGTPTSSTGAASLQAVSDSTTLGAIGALQAANQLGPLAFNLDSVRAFSAKQPPPGSNTGTVNYTSMDQWATGIAGLFNSTGALGFAENGAAYDPDIATHTGVLQTTNNLGPIFFDLNVLKAIGFTQAPTGAVLVNGQPDNFSAVDIGRWSAGIPGVITQTGTTGFVTYQDFGAGPISDYRVGGLHTTTEVAGMTFDFNVLPFISTGIIPPSLSFGLAPDMTAANTPFAPFSPPTPGVVQPFGGLPVPTLTSAPAPVAPLAASTPEAVAGTEAPSSETSRVVTTSTEEVPEVETGPQIRTPRVVGRDPYAPLKRIADAVGSFTGTRPTTASGAGATGTDAGGTGSGGTTGGTTGGTSGGTDSDGGGGSAGG